MSRQDWTKSLDHSKKLSDPAATPTQDPAASGVDSAKRAKRRTRFTGSSDTTACSGTGDVT